MGCKDLRPNRHIWLQVPCGQQASASIWAWAWGKLSVLRAPRITPPNTVNIPKKRRTEAKTTTSDSISESSRNVSGEAAAVQWSEIRCSSVEVRCALCGLPLATTLRRSKTDRMDRRKSSPDTSPTKLCNVARVKVRTNHTETITRCRSS
eukprot:scaffold652352_cov32-Prasinocladus_malaysianus.AAC.2